MKIVAKYRKLFFRAFLFAIAVLTANQIFIQYWLNKKDKEGTIINIAGRQRMLCQRLNLMILRNEVGSEQGLDSILSLWKTNHAGLIENNEKLDFKAFENEEAKKLLIHLNSTISNAEQIIASRNFDSLSVSQMNRSMDEYLTKMDKAVFLLSDQADSRLDMIIIIEILLFVFSVSLLIVEMKFIFLPVIGYLGKNIDSKNKLIREKKENILFKHTEYLKSLHSISVSKASNEEKIEQILYLMRDYLDLCVGIVSRIDEKKIYTVNYVTDNELGITTGDTYELANTICDITLNRAKTKTFFDDHFLFHESDLPSSVYAKHPAVQALPLKTYIGGVLIVDDKLYGTLNFSSTEEKEFFEEYELLMFIQAKDAIVYQLQGMQRAELQNENDQLALVTKSIQSAVLVTDTQQKIIWANEAFHRMTGFEPDEVLEKVPGKLLQGPESDPATIEKIKVALRNGERINTEILNYKKDGTPFWITLDIHPIHDNEKELVRYIAIQNDITEQVALRKQNEELALVATKTSNAIVITDPNGKINWVNQGAVSQSGYSEEELIGKQTGGIFRGPDTDEADIQSILNAIKEGIPAQLDMLNYNKQGDPYWVNVDLQPIYEGDIVDRFIIIETDITDQILEQQSELLSELRGEEKERNRISRDLHDGIGQMLVASRLLLKKYNQKSSELQFEKQKETLDKLLGEMITETRMIMNNLAVSLTKARSFKEALIDLVDKMNKIFDGNIFFTWKGGPDVGDLFYATNLFRIIQEAINNGIKYSGAENIYINVLNNDELAVIIEDDGAGFDLSHVSEGYGLSNMKNRAENLNLVFEIESEIGRGTIIRILD